MCEFRVSRHGGSSLRTQINARRFSRFAGALLDHDPPHFHAIYGQFDAEFAIDTGDLMKGTFPTRAEKLVREWSSIYRDQLEDDWQRARNHEALKEIPPLE